MRNKTKQSGFMFKGTRERCSVKTFLITLFGLPPIL
jgi:nitrate reductase NapE component